MVSWKVLPDPGLRKGSSFWRPCIGAVNLRARGLFARGDEGWPIDRRARGTIDAQGLAHLKQRQHVLARPLVHQVFGKKGAGAATESDAARVVDDDLDRALVIRGTDNAPVAIGDLAHALLLAAFRIGILEGAHLL